MTSAPPHILERSGLAALSDLENHDCQSIFTHLEHEQDTFLAKEDQFRSDSYQWPRDPLHCWSRPWEYPYVYHHLIRYLTTFDRATHRVVADVGSGVTFFPFSLAKLGYHVVCTDIDPVCNTDVTRACKVVPHSPGKVEFRLIEGGKLPFGDAECDAVYCISVLEHIPDFGNTVKEMARVLKHEGLCLVTCDLNLSGVRSEQLRVDQYKHLMSALNEQFTLLCPEVTIHPSDLLTTQSSARPFRLSSYARLPFRFVKQKILKPLLGRPAGRVMIAPLPTLAVLGLVLIKRK